MGKYDHLKTKLPAFQQKVDEAKSQYAALTAPELARAFGMERTTKKRYEDEVSKLNINLEALAQLLAENFEASGVSSMKLQTGETCYQQIEPYSSVQDQSALLEFIKKSKQQALLSLAWQTMNALNKDRLTAGKPPLPGTAVFLKTSIRLRGATNSQEE